MKEDLIEKLLKEQTTTAEEHLIAQMLKPTEEEIAQWMKDDDTAVYDQIVSQRHSKRRWLYWAAAAVVAACVVAGGITLWSTTESVPTHPTVTQQPATNSQQPVTNSQPHIACHDASPTTETIVSHKPKRRHTATAATTTVSRGNTADSLQYYIAKLEKELDTVKDHQYNAKAEEIIRADASLQRLVRRIMMGEITRNRQPAEAMLQQESKEEQP